MLWVCLTLFIIWWGECRCGWINRDSATSGIPFPLSALGRLSFPEVSAAQLGRRQDFGNPCSLSRCLEYVKRLLQRWRPGCKDSEWMIAESWATFWENNWEWQVHITSEHLAYVKLDGLDVWSSGKHMTFQKNNLSLVFIHSWIWEHV